MDESQLISDRISRQIGNATRGTLRFYGEWFGRPYDNIHTLVSCKAEHGVLQLSFSGGETLLVWAPSGLTMDGPSFRISDAARVRWEWFSYGKEKAPGNRFFREFTRPVGAAEAAVEIL